MPRSTSTRWTTFESKAATPTPGSTDLCLVASVPLEEVRRRIENAGVPIEMGPVRQIGAVGAMTSVYFRDPDATSSRSASMCDCSCPVVRIHFDLQVIATPQVPLVDLRNWRP